MEELKIDWKSSDYLNADDLNRIEEWTDFLSGALDGYGYYTGIIKRPQAEDAHTMLLLHGESIEDSSMYKVPLTNHGVVVSTAQSKFGGKSLYFDGAARILYPAIYNQLANTDWAIDWWEKCEENALGRWTLFDNSPGQGISIGNPTGAELNVSADMTSGWEISAAPFISVDTTGWVHWAVTRFGKKYTSYRNGKQYKSVLSKTDSPGFKYQYAEKNSALGVNAGSNQFFKGYIDEFRISDVARWTADFTPPDKPYEVEGKSLWGAEDIPSVSDADRIRANIVALRNGFFSIPDWRELVFGNQHDFNQQNAMEWDLQTCYNWIEKMIQIFIPSGVYRSGNTFSLLN